MIAHRGAPKEEPENTLASFARALKQGADVLETDLRFSRDGEIVLFHDATLERMTDGAGTVSEQSLARLKRLETRRPNGTLTAERIPTLVELLAMTGAQTPLLLELKDERFIEERYARRFIDTLAGYGMLDRAAVISFQPALVHAVRQLYPPLIAGYVTLSNPRPPRDAQLAGPFWPLLLLNPLYVRTVHRRGSIIAPLDPNPLPRLALYRALGVDALLADEPGPVVRALTSTNG
ncbi:MAG: glycerophosphodiester phosphodiesterase family protein [Caldilineaceae bacterium]|nr:glycerophosphodiester phosphodiesterase family protein [Caldilineaceae bacterium]